MSKVIHIESAAQYEEQIRSNTVVVVDFHALWCGPCKAIAPVYEKLASQLSEKGKMAFLKVDVDRMKDIAQANNITAMPTFVVYKSGTESSRVQGADMPKLSSLVKDLLSTSGGSALSSSSNWTGAEVPRGYRVINNEIDVKGLDCMNWKSELGSTIRTLFNPEEPSRGGSKGKGKGDSDWVESDTDEQLMVFIPFSSVVKVFQIQITSHAAPAGDDEDEDEETPRRPKTIKIFTNNAHILGFEEAEGKESVQTIELKEEDWKDGTAVINTRFVKFQQVGTLTLFVVDAEGGGECVRVDRVMIVGEAGEKKEIGKLEKVGEE